MPWISYLLFCVWNLNMQNSTEFYTIQLIAQNEISLLLSFGIGLRYRFTWSALGMNMTVEGCETSVVSSTLWPIDCTPPGFSVRGILQARILERVPIPFSRGSSRHRGLNLGCLHRRQVLYHLSQQEALWRVNSSLNTQLTGEKKKNWLLRSLF